ncbi:hypothetical protein JP0104_11340 [Helicobacter pylori]|nr:hypothetical protein JP0104_11340 [Helicobacter pylori]
MRSRTNKHPQTPFCIHHFRSNIVSCNEKFYTTFMNFKTKFKIFPKNKAKIGLKTRIYDKELKFFPWIR